MEMHVLPQSSVFEIADGRVLEVIDDGWTGIRLIEVSNTFINQKKQRDYLERSPPEHIMRVLYGVRPL